MNKILFLGLLLLPAIGEVKAQDYQSLDSVQRRLMKDSLQISDSVVSQVFAIRNTMYAQISAVHNDTTLKEEEKNAQIASIRSNTNNRIRQAMGEEKYQLYTDMIRRWASRRRNGDNNPLAGGN